MEMFKQEELQTGSEQLMTVGSARGNSQIIALWVEDNGECVSAEMTPTEARALAALLLKHADRAEGKAT